MSEKKPIPESVPVTRGLCPICGKASYSQTGTHPQCSVQRADAISRAAIRAAAPVAPPPRKPWSKTCPNCKHEVPSRRIVCDCGHSFEGVANGAPLRVAPRPSPVSGKKPR